VPKPTTINIRPGVSILSVLPHLNYKPWFALAEFVDNAVQSFLTNRAALEEQEGRKFALQVDIHLDPNARSITIKDNAAGIAWKDFPRAFRPAEIPPDAGGLSEFGMGMKSAACWFAPKWKVRTKALGETQERTVQFDIARIVKDSIEELDVAVKAVPRSGHYTEIVLSDLRSIPHGRTIGKIKDHLASIYRIFTRDGTLRLHFDGDPLKFDSPEMLNAPYHKGGKRNIEWKKRISFKLPGRRAVEGFVAIREKASTARAGLAIFRRKRLIIGSDDETYRPPEIFGSPNSFVYQRLFGELHLVGFSVSHTKDGIRWEDTEEEFISALRKAILAGEMPILDQANNYRAKGIQKEHKEVAEKALENIQSELEEDQGARLVKAFAEVDRVSELLPPKDFEPPTKPFKEKKQDIVNTIKITYARQAWQVKVLLSYDETNTNWYDITDYALDIKKAPREVAVRVSMAHPFMDLYCDGSQKQQEALIRIAVCLALAETAARDGGQKGPGYVRTNFNEILRLAFSGA
jgi:hypothetical protein